MVIPNLLNNMPCERCGKKEGEYLCSVCKRVVCEDCKIIDHGKVYCLDHALKAAVPAQNIPEQPIQQPKKEPSSLKTLKDLIFTVLFLLIGIVIILVISNFVIADLLNSIASSISEDLPQIEPVFTILTSFERGGLYAIITLLIILIVLLIAFRIKKRRYKNI